MRPQPPVQPPVELPLTKMGCGSRSQTGFGGGPAAQKATGYAQAAAQAAGHARHSHGSMSTGLNNVQQGRQPIRDPQRAEYFLQQIKASALRFANPSVASAAGYRMNKAGGMGADQHWMNSQANKIADATDFGTPATLMYHFDKGGRAKLTGVMLTHSPDRPLPDFGAGAWHRHPGDRNYHMHVFFDRSVAEGAFETNTGVI